MSDFDACLIYKYNEAEQIIGSVVVERIISKNGQLVSVHSLIYEETRFSKDLESFLRTCNN